MAAACFLLYAMVQFRDSILMRPHPAFWRVIHAMAILYCTSLVFLLMQAKELGRGYLAVIDPALGALFICCPHVLSPPKSHSCNVLLYLHRQRTAVGEPEGICHSEELGYGGGRGLLNKAAMGKKIGLCGEASLDAMYPPVFSCHHLSLHTMSQEYCFGRLDAEARGSRVMWGWGCRSIIISPPGEGSFYKYIFPRIKCMFFSQNNL